MWKHYFFFFLCVAFDSVSAGAQSVHSVQVETLRKALQRSDEDVVRHAAYELGALGEQAEPAVEDLVAVIYQDRLEPAWYAASALGRIGAAAAKAVPELVHVLTLSDADPVLRQIAARSLGSIGVRNAQVTAALNQGVDSDDALLRVESALAQWRLGQQERAIEALNAALANESAETAFAAAVAFQEMGSQAAQALPGLVQGLTHANADVRRASCKALAATGRTGAKAMIAALPRWPDIDRAQIAFALGEIIEEGLKETDPAQTLAFCRETLQPPLLELLSDSDAATRRSAGAALAKMKLAAVAPLVSVAVGKDGEARDAALAALGKLADTLNPDATAALSQEVASEAARALVDNMRHRDPGVRAAIFRVFAAAPVVEQSRRAVPLLREAFADQNVTVRRHAATALKRLSP